MNQQNDGNEVDRARLNSRVYNKSEMLKRTQNYTPNKDAIIIIAPTGEGCSFDYIPNELDRIVLLLIYKMKATSARQLNHFFQILIWK